MSLAVHAACMGQRIYENLWQENVKEDQGVDWRIILKRF